MYASTVLLVLIAVFSVIAAYAKGRIDGRRSQILKDL